MKLYTPNVDYKFRYPDEMEKILAYLEEHGEMHCKPDLIEEAYEEFSDQQYCASWMCVDDNLLEQFASWLSRVNYDQATGRFFDV